MAKKPSSRIMEIVQVAIERAAPHDGSERPTDVAMTIGECDEIVALCKAVDKRDQQLRKGKKMPVQTTKSAKKKARR